MPGVGGPLLTIGDLLSDLAVDGGDDPLAGVGDASVPSSPSASQQAGKANPSDLSRLFELRARFLSSCHVLDLAPIQLIDPSIVCCLYTPRLLESISQFGFQQEHYNNLMKALQENDPSWPSLMLKLCAALKTADRLVSCANTNAEQLLEKVKVLEDVLERGDRSVAEVLEGLQKSGLAKDHRNSQSKSSSK